jgi:acid phosphatase family membrane protein YuiD
MLNDKPHQVLTNVITIKRKKWHIQSLIGECGKPEAEVSEVTRLAQAKA